MELKDCLTLPSFWNQKKRNLTLAATHIKYFNNCSKVFEVYSSEFYRGFVLNSFVVSYAVNFNLFIFIKQFNSVISILFQLLWMIERYRNTLWLKTFESKQPLTLQILTVDWQLFEVYHKRVFNGLENIMYKIEPHKA